MSTESTTKAFSRLVSGLAAQLSINNAEADSLVRSIHAAGSTTSTDDKLDHLELLIAVSLNAKLRDAQDDARFKRLKFLLRNNNARAVKIAQRWVDHQSTFEEMLTQI